MKHPSGYKYEGHDSGTKMATKYPAGYTSPATHCNISDGATSVNVKNPSGHKGGAGGGTHGDMKGGSY